MPRLWRNRIAPGKINKARGVSIELMLFLGRFRREKRQRLQDALQAVIDNDFVLQAWKYRLHRFEIKAPSRDLWRFAIFREQKRKLLKAKIAVALHDELGRIPKEEEINQVFLLTRVMYKAVLGLHFKRQEQKRSGQLAIF